MNAEYIGLKAIVSEFGLEHAPPPAASGDEFGVPDEEDDEQAAMPAPSNAQPPALTPSATAIRYERRVIGLPFGLGR
jgi:hypothetical protein